MTFQCLGINPGSCSCKASILLLSYNFKPQMTFYCIMPIPLIFMSFLTSEKFQTSHTCSIIILMKYILVTLKRLVTQTTAFEQSNLLDQRIIYILLNENGNYITWDLKNESNLLIIMYRIMGICCFTLHIILRIP